MKKVDGAKLVIGHFRDSGGYDYLMFVNKDMRKSAKAVITMDPQALPLREIPNTPSKKRQIESLLPVDTLDYTVQMNLLPGEGKLFKIDK